ncbi:hypothetical protein pb186bvf_007911 [Paramecium bursaria]
MLQGRIFIQAKKRKYIQDQYDNFYPEEIDQTSLLSKRILSQPDYCEYSHLAEKRYCNLDLQYQNIMDGITVIPEEIKNQAIEEPQGQTIRLSEQSRTCHNSNLNECQETFKWYQVQERDYIDELGLNDAKVKKRKQQKKFFDNSIHKYKP